MNARIHPCVFAVIVTLTINFGLLLPRAAHAGMVGGMFMGHHGSTIQEFSEAGSDNIEYRYSSVRPGLPVKEGDVLFRGTKSGGGNSSEPYVLKGLAYVFKRGCPPAGYAVTGQQTNTAVVLHGAAPRRDPHSCDVAGYDRDGKNATLVFDIAE
jgi:hypothetical protein